jgi:hypothetical protein
VADIVAEVCNYSSEAAASISGNGSHHPLICRAATLDQTALTHDIGRLVVEYAPKGQFDLVSLGYPLDPILDGRGPALRAIDHQPPEVSLRIAYSKEGSRGKAF